MLWKYPTTRLVRLVTTLRLAGVTPVGRPIEKDARFRPRKPPVRPRFAGMLPSSLDVKAVTAGALSAPLMESLNLREMGGERIMARRDRKDVVEGKSGS